MDILELNAKVFSENINTRFTVPLDDSNVVELELIEVKEYDFSPGQEAFSIILRGPHSPVLHQAIRRIEHEKLGDCDLFLVPIAQRQEGILYEAAFNRFRK